LIERSEEIDWFSISRATRIVALLMTKSNRVSNDVNQLIQWITKQLRSKTNQLDISTALNALQTLLRKDDFRLQFFRAEGLESLNGVLRSQSHNFQILYQASYCCWLLSYNHHVAERFSASTTIIHKLVEIVRTIGKEKVIRMAVAALRNVVDKAPTNNEQMVETNLLKEVEKLLQKKWADEDIINDLEVLKDALQKHVAELSSFDKYKQELYSGALEWSPVHRSEKFWRENATKFEENSNRPLTVLVNLLKPENNPVILSVACYDIGEFVRFHPKGKMLLQNTNAKEHVMKLMLQQQDPEVQKQALLCLQKLMVSNWEYLSR
jgi:V-type H+-transporting ATPase subunit H